MIRKIYLFLSIILLLPALAYSQNASITGTVFNTLNNEPLPGAYVHFDGSDRGSTTDANGNFSIKGIVAGHYKIKVS